MPHLGHAGCITVGHQWSSHLYWMHLEAPAYSPHTVPAVDDSFRRTLEESKGNSMTEGVESGIDERDVDVRGTRIHLMASGTGPPLLYLHGAGDLGAWPDGLTALARRFSVYRPDHPGFNASGDNSSIDSVHDLAFFYLDLLDVLGLDSVILIGASFGGWLAADIASLDPSRVDKLVLVDAAGVRAETPTPDVFALSPVEVAEHAYHTAAARTAAIGQAAQIEQDPSLFERYLRNRMSTANVGWNPYMHDPKLLDRLHRIIAPTLIVWGAEDRLLPVAYAWRWAGLLPTARVEILEATGHLPLVEQPAAFLDVVDDFLGSVR